MLCVKINVYEYVSRTLGMHSMQKRMIRTSYAIARARARAGARARVKSTPCICRRRVSSIVKNYYASARAWARAEGFAHALAVVKAKVRAVSISEYLDIESTLTLAIKISEESAIAADIAKAKSTACLCRICVSEIVKTYFYSARYSARYWARAKALDIAVHMVRA